MSDAQTLLLILAAAIGLFIWNRLPVVVVAMAVGLALFFTGLLTVEQIFASFGEPVVIFIAGLFVVAAGLEATGVTAAVGQWMAGLVRGNPTRLLVLAMVMVALMPVVMLLAARMSVAPSKLLMPLAFASGAGSKLALTGTPKNVLIHDASMDAGYGGFGFFEFAWVGVPLLVGTVVLVVIFGRWLLPERKSANMPADLSRHARTLVEQYRLASATVRLRVREGSPLVGRSRRAVREVAPEGVVLVAALDGASGEPRREDAIALGDVLILRGDARQVAAFAEAQFAVPIGGDGDDIADVLLNRNAGLAEVVVPPRSPLVGRSMASGMVTESGDLVVLAIQRGGVDAGPGVVTLAAGDHMLLQGTWQALDRRLAAPEVLVVDAPAAVRVQAVPFGAGAWTMIAIVVAMVALLTIGVLPSTVTVFLAALAVVVAGLVRVPQAYRAIDWDTVILIAAMMPLATAMYATGTAEQLAEGLVGLVGDAGPLALLAGLFLFAGILGQLISNTATALILIPIAVATALELDVSAQPVLI